MEFLFLANALFHIMRPDSCQETEPAEKIKAAQEAKAGACPKTLLKDKQQIPVQKGCDGFRDHENSKHTFYIYAAQKTEDKVLLKTCEALRDGVLKPGGIALTAAKKPMATHFISGANCQQLEYPTTFAFSAPLKAGPCPASLSVASKVQGIGKKCESFKDKAGTTHTYLTYGNKVIANGVPVEIDQNGLETLCVNYKKSVLKETPESKN